MKAIVCTKYGSPDVLKLMDIAKDSPKNREIQIKIHATTVTSGDCRVRGFKSPLLYWIPMRLFLGISKPRNSVLGVELAGEVVAIGEDVRRFKKGDQVYALNGMRFGAHAQYICLSEEAPVALKPVNATYEEAAAIPFGGTTALHFLRKGKIQSGQKVLIYGASGAVGTAAVQLANHFGSEVTGVCSGANAGLVRSLGAHHVIDYTMENFAEKGQRYDLIFDAVGKISKAQCRKSMESGGRYVTVDGQGIAKVSEKDLLLLKELTEAGAIRSVIDRRYPLEQIADAYHYVEKGHKKGNVIITVGHEG
ncbi:NAD(P)-dependent alcohol dehydrogenase [Paenibacillus sp. JNUCC31]|uniref:NAD(P)-dependent alcohol dehydrogenase n=1 Tax=Paenibacillus sp. JNUCC-31 TaxID=2777983 RepID=UPI00177BC8A7|nr:NAD(P)-dependent alcohol dehydrogenase [Paenibacillus sp. JNUCC-31]QOS78055.1 NAD(P)-dependent alcohol dehydrogenase [Paenibacillus sp. JNUCC-31]